MWIWLWAWQKTQQGRQKKAGATGEGSSRDLRLPWASLVVSYKTAEPGIWGGKPQDWSAHCMLEVKGRMTVLGFGKWGRERARVEMEMRMAMGKILTIKLKDLCARGHGISKKDVILRAFCSVQPFTGLKSLCGAPVLISIAIPIYPQLASLFNQSPPPFLPLACLLLYLQSAVFPQLDSLFPARITALRHLPASCFDSPTPSRAPSTQLPATAPT